MFRHLGWSEATAAESLEAMRAAFAIAMREAWCEVHRIAREQGLSAAVLGRLGDALFVVVGRLWVAVEVGHRDGRDAVDSGVVVARDQLVRHLLTGEERDDVERLGARAGWPLPARSLVLCADLPERMSTIEAQLSDGGALVVVEDSFFLVLCDERDRVRVLGEVRAVLDTSPIAVSPPAPPQYLTDAVRLAIRAHRLVGRNVIPTQGIIDCADHEEALWLQSEPFLRDSMVKRLLAPLESQSPHRRQVLAMTLVIWLERHASAVAIGEQLGVHPQTVRYRLRQLDAMLGQRMKDPDSSLPMLLALKAVLPHWVAPQSSRQSRR